jgi:hypothetical protein
MSAQSSSTNMIVKVILWIYLVDNLAFGLVAVAIGAWLAQRKPEREQTYIAFGAAASLLAGVGLLWSELAGEYHGAGWFFGLTMLASFPMSAILVYARRLIGQTST